MTTPTRKMVPFKAPRLPEELDCAEVRAAPPESLGLVPLSLLTVVVGDVFLPLSDGFGDADDDDASRDAGGAEDGAGNGDRAAGAFQCVALLKLIEPVNLPNSVKKSRS